MRDLVIVFWTGVAVYGFMADWPTVLVCVAATIGVLVAQITPRKRGG